MTAGPGLQAPQPPPNEASRTRRAGRRLRRLLPFAAGAMATFLALALYGAVFPPPAPISGAQVQDAVASALASVTPPPAFSEAAWARIQPSLVLVEAERSPAASDNPASSAPLASTSVPPSARPSATAETASALGSGVVIDDQGDIMTALHVVDGAPRITVTFADGTRSDAIVASRNPAADIALLQTVNLPATARPAVLGNPGSVQVGSEAYVVGNPFGLYGSMSAGVVSALGRSFTLDNGRTISGLIQVDAAVNPGNSGGPLLNRDGQVIGIVDALINPTKEDVFVGIGLAVPIDVAGGGAGLPQY